MQIYYLPTNEIKKATENTVTNIQGHKLKKVQTWSLHETYKEETTKNSRNYKKFKKLHNVYIVHSYIHIHNINVRTT